MRKRTDKKGRTQVTMGDGEILIPDELADRMADDAGMGVDLRDAKQLQIAGLLVDRKRSEIVQVLCDMETHQFYSVRLNNEESYVLFTGIEKFARVLSADQQMGVEAEDAAARQDIQIPKC